MKLITITIRVGCEDARFGSILSILFQLPHLFSYLILFR